MSQARFYTLDDFEVAARAVLPAEVVDYFAGGSGSERALAANRSALDAVSVYPRMLAGAAADSATTMLASLAAMPVAIAPMAYQRLAHPDGELAMARAARTAGVPMMVSTLSSYPIEQIADTEADLWFQLYWLRDQDRLEQLIGRAEKAGCSAIAVTIDLPIMGRRLRDVRNEFTLPAQVIAANLVDESDSAADPGSTSMAHVQRAGASAVAAHTSERFGPTLSWAELEWLRARTSLPLVIKGILDPRDAIRAVEVGADAVVVSNHGGRQFDGAPASISALGAVVSAVGASCQVLFDSGIRSGTDVLRALALGASGVLVGRPMLWALAVDGADGVEQALSMLATEVAEALTLAGCLDVASSRDLRTRIEGSLR
ncbi:MAG: alpha-hydroxy acid oxidase [Jatrophihabitantaceae bacterium]